ncbi:MAG TPA: hypothetical protein VIL16_32470, partial [Trebonia sp.]
MQQRLQAELVEDGGVGELPAALAGDERALHGRFQADREQRRDRGDQAVEHDRDPAFGRREGDARQQRDLRSAEGRRQDTRVAQFGTVVGARPGEGAGDDLALALHHRRVGAGTQTDGGLGGEVEQRAAQRRGHGGVADADLAQADETVVREAASQGLALLDEPVDVVEAHRVRLDEVARRAR